jgi:hypothetical protein
MASTPPGTDRAAQAPPGRPGAARLALAVGGGAGLLLFITVVVAGIRKGQILTGIASGLFAGLLVAVAAAWFAMRLARPPAPPLPLDEAKAARVTAGLGPVLGELESIRQATVAQINARATWRVPVGVLIGVGLWLLPDDSGEGHGLFDLLVMIGISGFAGYIWAASKLGTRYRLLYKQRVLPLLAAQFGDLSWRQAVLPDLAAMRDAGIFPDYQSAIAEDELHGTHRNLETSIIELRLESHSGDDTRVHFNGLLVSITLPRGLVGSTAIIASEGMVGRLRGWLGREGRERVHLEDPKFDAIYEVWSTDQIAARALLTPAFMERLLALPGQHRFGRPFAITSGNEMTMTIPRAGGALFEPPSYSQPAASRDRLVALYDDIAAVLAVADAVIGLDYAAKRGLQ